MRYCPNCGFENNDNNKFCTHCGTPLDVATKPILDTGNIRNRSIPTCIILSILTCGIYMIYWQMKLNDEINYLYGDNQAPSGGMVVLLEIITCSIYNFYWAYKMGEKSDAVFGSYRSYNILFLALQFFALPIVSLALMQDSINKVVM